MHIAHSCEVGWMRSKHIIFVAPFETLLASKLGWLLQGYVRSTKRKSPYLALNRGLRPTNQTAAALLTDATSLCEFNPDCTTPAGCQE